MRRFLADALAALERRVLGLSAEEIRYTFEDVRAELRATRTELKEEIAALRRELERRPGAGEGPAADGAQGEDPAAKR